MSLAFVYSRSSKREMLSVWTVQIGVDTHTHTHASIHTHSLRVYIALSRLQGYYCLYLCELCRKWLYRDRSCGLIVSCVRPVDMFDCYGLMKLMLNKEWHWVWRLFHCTTPTEVYSLGLICAHQIFCIIIIFPAALRSCRYCGSTSFANHRSWPRLALILPPTIKSRWYLFFTLALEVKLKVT